MGGEVKKRERGKYFAVTKNGRVLRAKTEGLLKREISSYLPSQILLVCKGFELTVLTDQQIKLMRKQ